MPAQKVMGFAEFIIGPAEGRTRWLYPSYGPMIYARFADAMPHAAIAAINSEISTL
jgi:hypothetical protein